jgi:CubicO group peptidase (beta-lactamase class C family)
MEETEDTVMIDFSSVLWLDMLHQKLRAGLISFLLVAAASATLPSQAPSGAPPNLDAYVAEVMRAFEVPGIALTIVKDGSVVVAKGYGVKKAGEQALVDSKTLFGIASNTKVFTATALGLLVEGGRLEWDAPVIRYLPWFQMWDPT